MSIFLVSAMIAVLLGLLVSRIPTADAARGICPKVRAALVHNRQDTWKSQDELGVKRTRASEHRPAGCLYARWVRDLWLQRAERLLSQASARTQLVKLLNAGLRGTPMAGTGKELEAAGRRYDRHPAFIAAIAGTESSFGAAACSSNRFNAFGLSSCGAGWRVPNFQSWREVYEFMGRFLSERWAHAVTTYDFGGYAACSSCWGRRTAFWMRERFGVNNLVRYPSG